MTYELCMDRWPETTIENGCVVASNEIAEPKNAPELRIGRFLKSKLLGRNRVILVVIWQMTCMT